MKQLTVDVGKLGNIVYFSFDLAKIFDTDCKSVAHQLHLEITWFLKIELSYFIKLPKYFNPSGCNFLMLFLKFLRLLPGVFII